jgi:hypothetical protein
MQLLTVHSKAKVYIIGFPIQLQGCQIFLGATYKNWEKYPKDHKLFLLITEYTKRSLKYTKRPLYLCTKIFHCKAFQNTSKSGFLV